jgi:glycosyltransferase involved in cell wall biosynthesis
LKAILKPIPGKIEVESFKSPDELAKLSQEAGAFCLPSVKEPWGVVVHEFAALGIPLLLSDIVGASKTFLIPGYNGFSFKVGNAASLRRELICFFHLSEQEIREMGNRSKKLSQLITPELWAYKFLSVLYQE